MHYVLYKNLPEPLRETIARYPVTTIEEALHELCPGHYDVEWIKEPANNDTLLALIFQTSSESVEFALKHM